MRNGESYFVWISWMLTSWWVDIPTVSLLGVFSRRYVCVGSTGAIEWSIGGSTGARDPRVGTFVRAECLLLARGLPIQAHRTTHRPIRRIAPHASGTRHFLRADRRYILVYGHLHISSVPSPSRSSLLTLSHLSYFFFIFNCSGILFPPSNTLAFFNYLPLLLSSQENYLQL